MKFLRLLIAVSFVASFAAYANDIQVQDGYIRAVPPSAPVTAAFMQIHNQGDQARALVSASSAAADAVELHTHTHVDGVMQMRQVEKINLAPKSTTHLQPGGLHIMLIGLKAPLNMDDKVLVNLKLDDGSLIELNLPIRKVAGQGQMHDQHQPAHHQHMKHQHMKHQPMNHQHMQKQGQPH
ncbi:MAG: copper chaperone PCu(A)C [Pseudomonadaceae bacterium]|nr:copper chaperone PCu(A)C [Pseudomonadaceae bacterium]